MSFFNEPNSDAVTISADNATRGKRVGFLEAFDTAFQTQTRDAAMFGIQDAMRNLDDAQREAMRKAGLEDIPSLSTKADDPLRMFDDLGGDYLDAARFFQNGGSPAMAQRMSEYDAKIGDIQKKYPDLQLRTAEDMWNTVRSQAQDYERANALNRPADWTGAVGLFLGGMAGGLNPNTDPLNFGTLPVGGFGKNIATRIAMQGGLQGAVEGLNQITGVQEQRQLLGLSSGVGDALTRVGEAAIGGAFVQGAGELVGIGARKLFKGVIPERLPPPEPGAPPAAPGAAEPVPPPAAPGAAEPVPPQPLAPLERLPVNDPNLTLPGIPEDERLAAAKLVAFPESFSDYVHAVSPTSTTRVGKLRTDIDLAHVDTQLRAWDGPAPWQVPPKTDTAAIRPSNDFVAMPSLRDIVRSGNIDSLARRIDPDVMGRFDQLASEKQADRMRLETATQGRDKTAQNSVQLDQFTQRLAELDHKIAKVGAMKAKKLRAQRVEVQAEQQAFAEKLRTTESSNMSAIRSHMMSVDERMRDLAEPVSRAYSRAREQWTASEGEHNAVIDMIRSGSKEMHLPAEPDITDKFLPREPSIQEVVPQLREAPPGMKPGADAADVLAAVIAKQVESVTEAIDQTRASLKKILDPEAKTEEGTAANTITVPGYKEPLHLDNDHIIDDEGKQVTVREFLQRQLDTDEDLQAVTSCSIQ